MMHTIRFLHFVLMRGALLDRIDINYTERIVACEMMAVRHGWDYKTDFEGLSSFMRQSGLFAWPVEQRVYPYPYEDEAGKGRIIGTLIGMGF